MTDDLSVFVVRNEKTGLWEAGCCNEQCGHGAHDVGESESKGKAEAMARRHRLTIQRETARRAEVARVLLRSEPGSHEDPYVSPIIEALKAEMDIDSSLLARLYALLVLSKGTETTMEDVHDAWSLWCETHRPDHRSLVPFDQLPPHVQEFDRKYMNVIHRVAREHAGSRRG